MLEINRLKPTVYAGNWAILEQRRSEDTKRSGTTQSPTSFIEPILHEKAVDA